VTTNESRLLVLGAVAMFEPVNGYQIRRELMSWGVDDWAHLNPGSIYSVLATMTRRGHIVRHDLVEGNRPVAVYTVTKNGRAELDRLYAEAMTVVDPMSPLGFHTALSMAPLVDRQRFLELLERRLSALDAALIEMESKRRLADADTIPPHVERSLRLGLCQAGAERDWVGKVLAEVRAGGLFFSGEEPTWAPAADDPGWQMQADRERYQALLGL
jgi:DNA-binding PadR family transcriptional regulator